MLNATYSKISLNDAAWQQDLLRVLYRVIPDKEQE